MIWYDYFLLIGAINISYLVYYYGYNQIFNSNIKFNKIRLMIFLAFSILMFINNYYGIYSLRVIGSYIITFLFFVICLKSKIISSFILTSILCIISIIFELFLGLLISFSIKNIDMVNVNTYIKLGINIFYSLLLFLLFKNHNICEHFKTSIKSIEKVLHNTLLFPSVLIVLSIISGIYGTDYSSKNIFVYSIIIISILLFLFIVVIMEKNKKEKYILKSKYLGETISKYESIIEEYKILKHNLINDLLSIKSYPDEKLIDEKIKKYSKNYEWIDTIGVIPQGIQGLIYLKSEQAKKHKVKFIINASNISHIEFPPKSIALINDAIGIYLDNAIEESKKVKEKEVFINIYKIGAMLKIEIINEIVSLINIDKLGSINYSTKKQKSGLGLNYAKKISKGKIKTTISIINNYYKVVLKINIPKKKSL